MDLDQLERLLIILSVLSFGLVALGLIGEYLGWWNDIGEAIISFGSVAGVATGVVALVINATKGQVTRVAEGVEANGDTLERISADHGSKLDRIHDDHADKLDQIHDDHGEKLDRIHEDHGDKLDDHGEKLDRIHDDLGSMETSLSERLEQQHDVLVQIRDRL